jgi:CheY-like chemotaxis protein
VDDDEDIRLCLATALTKEGWRVTTAADGDAALKMLMTSPVPDVILADVVMPNMDGVSFCNCLRMLPRLARVPFVQMTAWQPPRRATGAAAMLAKPICLETLLQVVDSVSAEKS